MPRVVLSWLNDFLARPVTAADADRYLGEAGIAVTRVSSPGAGDPRVVVGRVEAQPPESDCCVTASVPTPERVSAPAGPPPPGTLVAVALPGAQLFDPRGRQGVRRIDRSRHDPSPVGLICTAADLGLGHDSGPYTLPDGSRPGTPVAQVLPPGPRAEVLQVTVPDTFVHAAGLWGLAGELAPRAGTARVTPRSDGTAAPPDGLAVDRPGWTVSASVVAHDGPSPALERIRPQATLAGLWSNDALGDALNVTAFEYGVRLAAFPAGDAGVRAVVGGSALAAAPAAELGWPVELPVAVEGARDPASRLLVLAAAPTEAADGGARCRAAVQRLAELLSPCRTGPVGSIPVTATGPASPPIRVHIGLSEIADVVGVALRPAEIAGLLARIGALVEPLAGGWLSVAIPASRSDLTAGAELMAEIVRLLGFRRLPPTVPADPVVVDRDTRRARRERARAAVVASGYQELVTPLAVDARPGRPNDAGRELRAVGVNGAPRVLRRRLVPGLESVAAAGAPTRPDRAVFELGTVVRPGGEGVALAVLRTVGGKGTTDETVGHRFAEVAATVSAALAAAGRPDCEITLSPDPHAEDEIRALVTVAGRSVGHLAVHGLTGTAAGQRAVSAEIALDTVLELPECRPEVAAPLGRPAVRLDIGLVVPDTVHTADVLRALRACGPLLLSGHVADVYLGTGVPDGHRAVTVRLEFGSPWRTLTTDEARRACAEGVAAAERLGVRRR